MPAAPLIWLLTIEHKHGEEQSAHLTEDAAKDALHAYVQEWWEKDGPGGDIPTDRDTVIIAYFYGDKAAESYSLTEFPFPDLAGLDLPALNALAALVKDAIAHHDPKGA